LFADLIIFRSGKMEIKQEANDCCEKIKIHKTGPIRMMYLPTLSKQTNKQKTIQLLIDKICQI